MLLVVKSIRQMVKETKKQINLTGIMALDRHFTILLKEIIAKQTAKRITEKTLNL